MILFSWIDRTDLNSIAICCLTGGFVVLVIVVLAVEHRIGDAIDAAQVDLLEERLLTLEQDHAVRASERVEPEPES